jgi:hypothetical protein
LGLPAQGVEGPYVNDTHDRVPSLGLINLDRNRILKVFSFAAMLLLLPR